MQKNLEMNLLQQSRIDENSKFNNIGRTTFCPPIKCSGNEKYTRRKKTI